MGIPTDHEVQQSADMSVRKVAAAVSGAIEGFAEALEEFHVREEAKKAVTHTNELTRAVVEEGRTQAQTPEMQQVKGYAVSAGHAASDAAHRLSAKTSEGVHRVEEKVQHVRHDVQERVESAKLAAMRVKEDVKAKAEAVGETGRRAKEAPPKVAGELKAAGSAWMRGLAKAAALWTLIGVVALTAWVVLTIGLVELFAEFIGVALGAIAVAVIYLVVAGIFYGMAKSARKDAREEAREHIHNSKEQVRYVVRPVRQAFGRGRAGH